MKCEFVPVDYDYFDFEGKNYIRLIGRDESLKKICVVDSYEPNFYVILKDEFKKDAEKIAKEISSKKVSNAVRETKITKTVVCNKNFLGKEVTAIRVFITNHKDAHEIASEIGERREILARREYDIPLITKYIKEKKVLPLSWHSLEGEILSKEDLGGFSESIDLDKIILAKKIEKIEGKEFNPKIITFDIESEGMDPSKGDLLSIGMYGKDFEKVLTWKKYNPKQKYVEILKNESSVIERFIELVKSEDPDILAGYFSDGFDIPFLRENARINKINFGIGLDNKEPKFTKGKIPSAKIAGIVHIDLFRFVDAVFSQYLESESLGLGSVAEELVGETKLDFDWTRLGNMKDEDWKNLFTYNLQDARVTYLLAQKLLPDMIEFSKIVKEPLFEITRNRMAAHVENYIIHNIDEYNEIVEKKPVEDEIGNRRNFGKFEGAFVFEPKPGLYENLVFFDFTSMYPSVIITYNLSRSTHEGNEKFSKEPGFFPLMLNEIIEKRKKYKKELSKDKSGMAKARSNAYKLLANASYGYLAFFGARYYCREAAASTARLARENIKKAISEIGDRGYEIVYSDTDSIAFLQGKKTKEEILEMLEEINKNLPGIMELDLEDFYKRGIFVTNRGGTAGAKKKYALIDKKDKLKIRGFETVRRDWCPLARTLQSMVLASILLEGNEKKALEILKKVVSALKKREVDKSDLIIKTKLKKQINSYEARGPHVAAAEKMKSFGVDVGVGSIIEYYVGEVSSKTKRISDRVFLPDEEALYDIDYYLNNQVLPSVENIFDVFGVDVKAKIEGESQKKLF